MSISLVEILLVNYFLLIIILDPASCIIERIQRFHSREIKVDIGDTVKLQWKFDVDKENRKEELRVFCCGYRLKDFSKKSYNDPPIIPLALSVDTKDFFSVNDQKKSRGKNLKSLFIEDTLGIGKNMDAYIDRKNGHCTMELENLSVQLDKVEEFACSLQYAGNSEETENIIGGITKIMLNKIGNKPAPFPAVSTTTKSSKLILRGEIFLGAILFDVLFLAAVLSASLIWNRKSKGYTRVDIGIMNKKKKNKKDEGKKDLEKGKDNKNEKIELKPKALSQGDKSSSMNRKVTSQNKSSRPSEYRDHSRASKPPEPPPPEPPPPPPPRKN